MCQVETFFPVAKVVDYDDIFYSSSIETNYNIAAYKTGTTGNYIHNFDESSTVKCQCGNSANCHGLIANLL
ncbi:MAG: hypothetical protein ACJA04_000564 [Cellvibrionaceae bacterium]